MKNEECQLLIGKEEDYEQIVLLNNELRHYHGDEPFKLNQEYYKQMVKEETKEIIIATYQNVYIGFAIAKIQEFPKTNNKYGYLMSLYVKESYRGLGAGSLLYDASLEFVKGFNVSQFELGVKGGNDSAVSFYKKKGMDIKSINMGISLEYDEEI